MATDNQGKIDELLSELNRWRRLSGSDPSTPSDVRSTGESNAAIEDLRQKLDQLGVRYHWNDKAQEYQLDEGGQSDERKD